MLTITDLEDPIILSLLLLPLLLIGLLAVIRLGRRSARPRLAVPDTDRDLRIPDQNGSSTRLRARLWLRSDGPVLVAVLVVLVGLVYRVPKVHAARIVSEKWAGSMITPEERGARKKEGVEVFLSSDGSRGYYRDSSLYARILSGERTGNRIRFHAAGGLGFWIRFDGNVDSDTLGGEFEAGIQTPGQYSSAPEEMKWKGRLDLRRASLSEEEKRKYANPPLD